MRGNLLFTNRMASDSPDCPIKTTLNDKSVHKIISTITDEMWREIIRQKQFSHYPMIIVPGLGTFAVRLSELKKFVFISVRKLRKLRAKLEIFKQDPKYVPEESRTYLVEQSLVLKTKAAWQQLNALRKVIILRTIRWNAKKRLEGKEELVKVDYRPSEYPFIESYIKSREKLKLVKKD